MKQKLYFFFCIVISFLFANGYSQNSWDKIYSNKRYNLFVDKNIKTAKERLIFFIAKKEYSNDEELSSEFFWYAIDCKEKKAVLMHYYKKLKDGKEEDVNYDDKEFHDIEKESDLEFLFNNVCPLLKN